MKRGDTVQQIMPAPFQGAISHFSIDQETGEKLVHVVAENGDGRFFPEKDLKLVGEQPPNAPVAEA